MRQLSTGVNQARVRDHNERLVLSSIQRGKSLSAAEIARATGLSAQTVSVICRALEDDGVIRRGDPQRGRVGKPRVPLNLDPDGVFSFGLKIGRRSADLVLMDFVGTVRQSEHLDYHYPRPEPIFAFLEAGLDRMRTGLSASQAARITGLGIAAPFELWNWHEALGAPRGALDEWRDIVFDARIAAFSDLGVLAENDGTAAARAEHVFGQGPTLGDFAYVFVGSFVGGGVVLNDSVYEGRGGNAGAFGTLPIALAGEGRSRQLIDHASLYLLESAIDTAGGDASVLRSADQDWSAIEDALGQWIDNAARHLARASVAVASVIDFPTIVVDGNMPAHVRTRLTTAITRALEDEDMRGIRPPAILAGQIGPRAREIGAATLPIFSNHLLGTHAQRL